MPTLYSQKSSPGSARGLSSFSPKVLLPRLQSTQEVPYSCHLVPQAPQSGTHDLCREDSSLDLPETALKHGRAGYDSSVRCRRLGPCPLLAGPRTRRWFEKEAHTFNRLVGSYVAWKILIDIRLCRPASLQMIRKEQDGGGRMGGAFEWTLAAIMERGEVSTLLG